MTSQQHFALRNESNPCYQSLIADKDLRLTTPIILLAANDFRAIFSRQKYLGLQKVFYDTVRCIAKSMHQIVNTAQRDPLGAPLAPKKSTLGSSVCECSALQARAHSAPTNQTLMMLVEWHAMPKVIF